MRLRFGYTEYTSSLISERINSFKQRVPILITKIDHFQEMQTTNSQTDKKPPNEELQTTEDVAIFGSLNSMIADYFYERAENALSVCISSLPNLSSTTGGEMILLNRLKSAYWRNIDLFALYCKRNIFTTGIFKPRRRQSIATLYNDESFDIKIFNEKMTQDQIDATSIEARPVDDNSSEMKIPNCPEPRSAEDLLAVQQENQDLRTQIKELKRKREEAKLQVNNLHAVKELVDEVEKNLAENIQVNALYKDVTSAVMGCRDLQELQGKGKQLLGELIRLRNNRSDDDDKNEIEIYSPIHRFRDIEKSPSLKEKIERDKSSFVELDQVLVMISDNSNKDI